MPVLPERSKEDTKIYCILVLILITKARATGDGVCTIFDYMPKHCSYKIGPIHASTTRKGVKKIQTSIADLWLY